ncbi:MAG: SurA N-terminal domain-containing protein [Coriobacteriia bacterium]|nr:SurA N-terminal domain-containing protein [Coriobacteriia bacterium]
MKKLFISLSVVVACLIFCGCSVLNQGIAARVETTDIMEDKVTEAVQQYRESNNLLDDAKWKKYLNDSKMTAYDFRDQILDNLINDEVKNRIAQIKNITVTDEELDNQVSMAKSLNNDTDFREVLRQDLINEKVAKTLVADADLTSTNIGRTMLKYSDKFNGSTGYYQIIFPSDKREQATNVYNNIKSGKVSFEEACTEVTSQDKTGINFDYIIYDCFIENPEPAKTRLTELNVGDVSEMIDAGNYIYMFKVVDKIHCSSPLTRLSELSDFTQRNIEMYAKIENGQNIYQTEFDKYKNSMYIKKFIPPANLSYAV